MAGQIAETAEADACYMAGHLRDENLHMPKLDAIARNPCHSDVIAFNTRGDVLKFHADGTWPKRADRSFAAPQQGFNDLTRI